MRELAPRNSMACCKCRTGARSSVWKRQDELSHRFFDCGTLAGRHPNAGKPVVSKILEDRPILG